LLDTRECNVKTAAELNSQIQDIFALDSLGRGDEICGTLHVRYSDDLVKSASLVPVLEARGVIIAWHRDQ
jgi:hypothetical protein